MALPAFRWIGHVKAKHRARRNPVGIAAAHVDGIAYGACICVVQRKRQFRQIGQHGNAVSIECQEPRVAQTFSAGHHQTGRSGGGSAVGRSHGQRAYTRAVGGAVDSFIVHFADAVGQRVGIWKIAAAGYHGDSVDRAAECGRYATLQSGFGFNGFNTEGRCQQRVGVDDIGGGEWLPAIAGKSRFFHLWMR
ncbi:hypothetical protein IMSAGC006_02264 [Muribaculaceae bacterium]|nr:hypothetical protein IMSAGC006_02264 [Muribaculaceae bacterium]